MAEATTEQTVSTEQPASTETGTEPTLEQVFESFKVEAPQPDRPAAQPAQPAQPDQPQIIVPDPALDPEGFRKYETQKTQDQLVLRQALQHVAGKLNQFEVRAVAQQEEQDIKKAVGILKEKNADLDDDFIEIALGQKARKEPRFLQVWKNRAKNPQAWNAALKAYSNEMAGKFTVKADSQLAENQRAMKASQQAMATGQKDSSVNEKLGSLQGAEFDRAMDRIKDGQSPFK